MSSLGQRPSFRRANEASSVSVLDRSVNVTGSIRGQGDLLVDGRVDGRIQIDGHLTISEEAQVNSKEGPVEAGDVTIAGTLRGTLQATGRVHLMPGGELAGEVVSSRFTMDAGAVFAGRLDAEFDLPAELTQKPSGKRR
jgi:cytoskeletal protein CcmA (bactofilin family)